MTPHKQMTKWDSEGQAYVIQHLRLEHHAGFVFASAEVLSHSEQWLQIREPSDNDSEWINMAHVVALSFQTL